MKKLIRTCIFPTSLAVLALAGLASPAVAQTPTSGAIPRPAFVDERRLPSAPRESEDRQRAAEEEARRATEELRKRFEAEAAALRAELESAAAEHRKRLEAETAAHSQRLAIESEERRKAEEETRQSATSSPAIKPEQDAATEAARKTEAERQAKAAEEARRQQAAEAEAARKAEAERQAKAAEETRRQQAAEAEAARKADAERQAKAAEEARRKALNIAGNPADGQRHLARGQQLLANGDFASARLFLERASDAGSADATLLLAETYDPDTLQRMGAVGIAADRSLARRWYERAAALGSTVAAERIVKFGGR